jgi:catechol 2,3-dioxygenase-like lactoylglutathione lyase family enzyme
MEVPMAVLYDRLVPILLVSDLQAERDFYVGLGFTISYEGPEFPTFVALAHGPIEFGIQHSDAFAPELADRVLAWQFGVRDVEIVKERLTQAGVPFREEWVRAREDWQYRVLHARTPNGYHLMLEEGKRD